MHTKLRWIALLLAFATSVAAQDRAALAERYARAMERMRISWPPTIVVAPDDSFYAQSADDLSDELAVSLGRGTLRIRIAEYRDRWRRAETETSPGLRLLTRSFSRRPTIPSWARPLGDDLSWRSPETAGGTSLIIAAGQSNTGLRYMEVPGVDNTTAQFVRVAIVVHLRHRRRG